MQSPAGHGVAPAAAALDALLEHSPADWLGQRPENGERLLDVLHAQCADAGLAPQASGQDAISTLHSLFDVALEQGLGEVIIDYVAELCADPFLTSADPVEAFLMDGLSVQQWARRALSRCRARFMQGLQQGATAPGVGRVLSDEAGRLHVLVLVLQALATAEQASRAERGDLAEAQRLLQAAHVAEFAVASAGGGRVWGRFASKQEWRAVANRRRDGAAPDTLFLADRLQELRAAGCEVAAYPFASLEKTVELFLSGPPDASVWRAKLAIFTYALADAGQSASPDSLRHAFGVQPRESALWQAAFWLDDAARGEEAADSLEAACRLLPGVADAETPSKVVAALAARGAPDVALAVQRARGRPAETLPQAQVLLAARLACGLLTEATVEVQRFLASPAGTQDVSAAAALAEQLTAWAADNGQLQGLAELPLAAGLEAAVLAWLQAAAEDDRVAGALLPLFLLQRGALAEAAAASDRLDGALAAGSLQEDEYVTQQRRALVAAARRLLPSGSAPDRPQLPTPHATGRAWARQPDGNGPAGNEAPDNAVKEPGTPGDSTFAVRLGQAGPQQDAAIRQRCDTQTPEIQPAQRQEAAVAASNGRPQDAARPMQQDEWQATMGIESPAPPSTGPRTRQAAKRQRLASQRR